MSLQKWECCITQLALWAEESLALTWQVERRSHCRFFLFFFFPKCFMCIRHFCLFTLNKSIASCDNSEQRKNFQTCFWTWDVIERACSQQQHLVPIDHALIHAAEQSECMNWALEWRWIRRCSSVPIRHSIHSRRVERIWGENQQKCN